MIRWPGLIVVSWIVKGVRTVRANHCAGAQYRMHLLAGHRHVGVEIGTHRGQLLGSLTEFPQPVRGDLGYRLGAADEDTEHLGGRLDIGERRPVGQPVVEQASTIGCPPSAPSARRRSTIGVR